MTTMMQGVSTIACSMMIGLGGCSQSSTPTPVANVDAPANEPQSAAELMKRYDPASLVEAKTLRDLPADLRSMLGVHGTDFDWIADVGEPCDPTDVISRDYPSKCFLVAGISATSALVAYKKGGYEGQSGVGAAYVHSNWGWTKVASWGIGYPSSLRELREMTSFAPDDRSPLR
jgi:hypothetical protein